MRKEAGFEFTEDGDGFIVSFRKRKLGRVITMLEASGRYCFRLGCDDRANPRTYRGKVRAARALQAIDALKQEAKGEKLSLDQVIVRAWDGKPRTAQD